jgi:dynein heavy chain
MIHFILLLKCFLSDLDLRDNDPETISQFIAQAYSKVIENLEQYLKSELKYNYTTPKSYLEVISLFKSLLDDTRKSIIKDEKHFSKGIVKLQESPQSIEIMKKKHDK